MNAKDTSNQQNSTQKRGRGRPNRSVQDWLYKDLIDLIHALIQEKASAMPTEKEMSRKYGISQTTLRKVLNRLEEEGWVQRKHGSGTYLNAEKCRSLPESDTSDALSGIMEMENEYEVTEKARVRAFSVEYPKVNREFWEGVLADFSKRQPGIELELSYYPNSKVVTAEKGEELADVFNLTLSELPLMVEKGLLMDMSSLAAHEDLGTLRGLSACRFRGGLYAMPQEFTGPVVLCNAALAAKIGFDPDAEELTWERLSELEARVHELDEGVMLMNMPNLVRFFQGFDIFAPGRWPQVDNYAKPQALEMMEWLKRMSELERGLYRDHDQSHLPKFIAGELVFACLTSFVRAEIDSYVPFETRILRSPKKPGTRDNVALTCLAINKTCKSPLNAWKWIRHMTSVSGQMALAERHGRTPALADPACHERFCDTRIKDIEVLGTLADEGEAKSLASSLTWRFIKEVWRPEIQSLFSGVCTVEEALNNMRKNQLMLESLPEIAKTKTVIEEYINQ